MQLSLTSLFTLAVLALSLSSTPFAAAKTKNCRRCVCTVDFGGFFKADPVNLKAFMTTATTKMCGSVDDYHFQTGIAEVPGQVGTKVWQASVEFYRLCGNANFVSSQEITINHYNEGASTMTLNCLNCDKKLKCLKGSKCENSGLD